MWHNDTLCDILVSCFNRHDKQAVKRFIVDWTDESTKPVMTIKTFRPGTHYHTDGKKFNTYDEASSHLEKEGFRVGGTEVIRTPYEGD